MGQLCCCQDGGVATTSMVEWKLTEQLINKRMRVNQNPEAYSTVLSATFEDGGNAIMSLERFTINNLRMRVLVEVQGSKRDLAKYAARQAAAAAKKSASEALNKSDKGKAAVAGLSKFGAKAGAAAASAAGAAGRAKEAAGRAAEAASSAAASAASKVQARLGPRGKAVDVDFGEDLIPSDPTGAAEFLEDDGAEGEAPGQAGGLRRGDAMEEEAQSPGEQPWQRKTMALVVNVVKTFQEDEVQVEIKDFHVEDDPNDAMVPDVMRTALEKQTSKIMTEAITKRAIEEQAKMQAKFGM
mmetsp:Transcript_88796/g.203109  ORF Transcript_88796/g.203109 Transcript_88796/m.203109 type:complete len:298 (+) Transcript_88796:45-938(+)